MTDFFDNARPNKGKNSRDEELKPLNTKEIPKRQTAVALQESVNKTDAPIVKAAGRGAMAEKILALAYENGIKVREDSMLAEMLAEIEIDSPIPSEAFMAVAEILSYLYQANGKPNPFDTSLFEDGDDDGNGGA